MLAPFLLTALLDANVLYPAPLRDLLMHLATARLYQARWSAQIHEEWIRNLLLNRPDLMRNALESTRDMMNKAVPNATVDNYERWMRELELPDADDRHVLAAAIESGAEVIVTFNTRDFPASALEPFGMVAQRPDEFVQSLMDADEDRVILAVKRQRAFLKKPPKTVEEHLQTLEEQGLPHSVARLQLREDEL